MTRPCCNCGTALVTYRGDKPMSALSLCLPCWRTMTAAAIVEESKRHDDGQPTCRLHGNRKEYV